MFTQLETLAALVPLGEVLLINPAWMLLLVVLLSVLLFGGRSRPAPTPTYTVVTVPPPDTGTRGVGCLPLLVLLLVIFLAIILL